MADYVSTLKADTSQHDRSLQDAAKQVSNYKKEADKASGSINKMTESTSRSTRELMKEMSSMENLGRSTTNYRRQLSDLQKQIADLTINYKQMTDEQKNGAFGQEVAAKIVELKSKASEYKDAILDVQDEIKNMASDTQSWDAVKQGIGIVSSSLQTLVGMSGLSADSQEKLLKVINKVKLAETAANTAINIGNALQRQSALMIGIRNIQEKAQVKAIGASTLAQKGFNLVAKANPYVLLASAIIGVVGALAAFSRNTKQSMSSLNDFKKAANNLNDETGNSIAQFKILQNEYKSLKTEAEKNEFIKDNKDKFEQWGLSINDVNDANEKLIKDGDKVVEMIILQAQAAALAGRYQEEYAKFINDQLDKQAKIINRGTTGSQTSLTNSPAEIWQNAGLTEANGGLRRVMKTIQDENGKDLLVPFFEVTPEGEKMIEEYALKCTDIAIESFDEGMSPVTNLLTKLEQRVANIKKGLGGSRSRGSEEDSKETDTKEDEEKVLAGYELASKKADELWAKLKNMEETDINFDSTKQDFIAAQREAERLKKILDDIRDSVNPKTPESKSEKTDLEKYRELMSSASEVQLKFDIGLFSKEQAQKEIDNINKQLTKLGIKLPVELDLHIDQKDISKTIDEIGASISSLGSIFSSLGQSFELPELNVVGIIAGAVASILQGYAAASAQSASMGPIGWAAFTLSGLATVAGVIAQIHDLSKYAEGGIIQGASSIGDYNIARVNAGEMILNGSQQQRLFNMINTGGMYHDNSSVGGNVEFKIRGNELVGVLNNYNSKRSKL